jgi:nucleoside-diphosphate-sugar epimerase
MRVLVTGGAGYIGSEMIRLLLDKGYDVVCLDRLFFGMDSLLEVSDRIKIVKDDIRWFDPSILDGVDAVFDLAALSNDPSGELDPEKTMDINYKGRVRVAQLAKKHGVSRYVFASSCSIYGFKDEIVNESSTINPLTTYAKACALAEKDNLALADGKYSVTVLRQATVYGSSHRMRFDLAINGMALGFFKSGKIPIMRDGRQWRPFVHVKDTSNAFLDVLEADPSLVNKQTFNVGSDNQNVQIFDLAQNVADSIGIPFDCEWYGSPDNRSYRVDFGKIGRVLKYATQYKPGDGAKEVFQALKEGKLNGDDPRTITVRWYKYLLESQRLINDIALKGVIL